MQTAPGTAGVVDAQAGLRAAVRTRGRSAASSPTAVGATTPPGVGRRRPALGLGWDLIARRLFHNLRIPRRIFPNGLRAARPRRRLGCRVQIEQGRVAQRGWWPWPLRTAPPVWTSPRHRVVALTLVGADAEDRPSAREQMQRCGYWPIFAPGVDGGWDWVPPLSPTRCKYCGQ